MKVEGFIKVSERFYETFVRTFRNPKKMIARIGFLNFKIKGSLNVYTTFRQRCCVTKRFVNVILLPGDASDKKFSLIVHSWSPTR